RLFGPEALRVAGRSLEHLLIPRGSDVGLGSDFRLDQNDLAVGCAHVWHSGFPQVSLGWGLTRRRQPSAPSRLPSIRRSHKTRPLLAGKLRHKNDTVFDLDHDRLQSIAETWAAEAFAVGDAKFGTMGGADDAAAVGGQKAARHPIERCANVRTGIDV